MSPGSSTESYPAFAHIGLRENPGKNLNQVTCTDRDSNPGHLVSQPDALTITPQFKVCHGSLYAVMWLADEPREFNLPTLPQRRITYVPEKLPSKYGVHSEEIRTMHNSHLQCLTKFRCKNMRLGTFNLRHYCSAGPTPWPARSPDMNPLEFYLWTCLKSLVYASAVPNVEVLQQRTEHGCGIVLNDLKGLCNVQRSLRRCNEIIFPCTRKVLKLFCTLPVTTATPERSFSTLRYLKTYLRSTMGADRLNGLALMYIHKNVKVKAHEVLDEMSKKPRRLLL
ncbi:hypothetical protein ANN_23993 [Periplaneta americana]|uniref:HAT C-terminal dimerisation domain-containing protein n=1 Tax=Periplaneta americana TaxID=6978 RepID=A0ABQ8S2J0_PERAM|nr:hypothetical protein ANN_23993 [Periplaneta americana]